MILSICITAQVLIIQCLAMSAGNTYPPPAPSPDPNAAPPPPNAVDVDEEAPAPNTEEEPNCDWLPVLPKTVPLPKAGPPPNVAPPPNEAPLPNVGAPPNAGGEPNWPTTTNQRWRPVIFNLYKSFGIKFDLCSMKIIWLWLHFGWKSFDSKNWAEYLSLCKSLVAQLKL